MTTIYAAADDPYTNHVLRVDTVANLRLLDPPPAGLRQVMLVEGLTTPGTLGQYYFWSEASTATDDGDAVVKPTSVTGAGRWLTFVASHDADLAASGGSALVGFLQAGTGAVARTVQGKLRDVQVTPQDFSAVADGSTDDILAINKAVDYLVGLGGGVLFFPEGTYMVSSAVKLRDNIVYHGAGCGSIIKARSNSVDNVFAEATPAAAYTGIVMRDLAIDGNRANVAFPVDDANGNGIRLNQVSHSRFQNLYIHDVVYNGISIYNASNDNVVENCRIEDVGKTGVSGGSHNGVFIEFGANRNCIKNNRIVTTRDHGVFHNANGADASDNIIAENFISGAAQDGIRVGDDAGTSTINRPKILNNAITAGDIGIRVYNSATTVIESGVISGNTVTGSTNGGIYLQGAATRKIAVNGNVCRNNGGYGISNTGTDNAIDGNICLGNTTDQLQDSGLRTALGHNITTAGGANSGAYGSFTPNPLLGGAQVGMTFDIRSGRYRIDGNVVHYWGRIVLTAKGSSTGALTIDGFPFTSDTSATAPFPTCAISAANLTYAGHLASLFLSNTTALKLYSQASASGLTALDDNAVANNSEFYFEGSYRITNTA